MEFINRDNNLSHLLKHRNAELRSKTSELRHKIDLLETDLVQFDYNAPDWFEVGYPKAVEIIELKKELDILNHWTEQITLAFQNAQYNERANYHRHCVKSGLY